MLTEKIQDGGTFYYILKCHHSNKFGEDYVTFDVFRYEFHDGDDDPEKTMYDLELMFNTEEEAKKYADILKNKHYKEKTKKRKIK